MEALQQIPQPENTKEVSHFLGLVTYYCRYIPDAATLTHPLNQLLHKGRTFHWNKECEQSFQKLKEIIGSDSVLVPYKRDLPITLATDASPYGISAVLSQIIDEEERPIMFASRSLTVAKSRYSQLDREALALFWGTKKFFLYLYGRKVTFIVDNKPLQQIFNPTKNLFPFAASRMMQYATYLNQFDYDIKHQKSSQHVNADYFSQCVARRTEASGVLRVDECFFLQKQQLKVLKISTKPDDEKLAAETIRKASREDPKVGKLIEQLKKGQNKDPNYMLNNEIVFFGSRVVIPEKLQQTVLQQLHATHMGIVKMKAIAQKYVFWENINRDIESMVQSCKSCADFQKDPKKTQIHHWEIAERCFQRVHIDYAQYKNQHFLIVNDAHSKWLEVFITRQEPTSEITIKFLREYFSRFGFCEELTSDNAAIFTSGVLKNFLASHNISQSFIAPGHPATNGAAERHVQFIKDKLKKVAEEQGDMVSKIQSILMRHHITPLQTGRSPSEMLFG